MANEYDDDTLTRMCDEDYDEDEDGATTSTGAALLLASVLLTLASLLAWWS